MTIATPSGRRTTDLEDMDGVKMENEYTATKYKGKIVVRPIKDVNKDSEYFLTQEQIEKLINNAPSNRDKVMLELMAFCGLRRDEVRSLKIENIDFENGWLNLTHTKRGKKRTVPVTKDVLRDLSWLVGKKQRGWLFESRNGNRLSLQQINNIVAKSGKNAELPNPNPKLRYINPHILRHSFSRNALKKGMRMEVLQKILGHSSVTTTINIYGVPSLEDIKNEYEKVSKDE